MHIPARTIAGCGIGEAGTTGAPELSHPRAALGIRPVHAEDRVLVREENDRAAMCFQITLQRLKVGVRALAQHEAQLHQFAGRIVNEHQ